MTISYWLVCGYACYVLRFFFLMIRRPPRSTLDRSSAASDVYKRQLMEFVYGLLEDDEANALCERITSDPQVARAYAKVCLLYTSPSPRDRTRSRMPSSA